MLQSQMLAAGETINPLLPALPDLVWSAVVFAIILVFFWFRVLPNIKALLDARSAALEGNIEKASAAQQEAEAALATYTAQLAEARAEAGSIREAARADGSRIIAEQKETASSEAARIVAAAEEQIKANRQAVLVTLKGEVGTLAIDLAATVLGEILSEDAKSKAVVDRYLKDLETSEKAAK
jgi:F-type H+-transporting ATPase subunit b